MLRWETVRSLRDVVTGKITRGQADITIFKSVGLALEDVAAGARVLERAEQSGLGERLPF